MPLSLEKFVLSTLVASSLLVGTPTRAEATTSSEAETAPKSGETFQAILVEAEDFTEQRANEIRQWQILPTEKEDEGDNESEKRATLSIAKNASNGKFVRLLPDSRVTHDDQLIKGTNFSDVPGELAILSYPVEIKFPGRYYVWVSAYSTGSEDNGIHVGMNGQWSEHGRRMQWCQGKNTWRWECAQRTKEEHCGVPMEIYLDIETAGTHTIEFSMREDGFTMDRFLLTNDKNYRPE